MVPDHDRACRRRSPRRPGRAAPGTARRPTARSTARGRARRWRRRSDAPSAARARPPAAGSARGTAPFSGAMSTTWSSPFVSVPVLSKATQRTAGQPLEVRAALDQHALARRGRERRHHRDRRRDHERARAGDHQQDERAVDPAAPARRPGGAAAGRPIDERDDQHRRRVDAREPLDERLARRALRPARARPCSMMRASVESPRSRVTRTSSAPRPLIVPANTSSPVRFSAGSDSPVTGAWLTWLSPAATTPSSGIFSPGLTTTTVADRDAVHGHAAELAGRGVAHERLGGRQVHERADGAARPLHRARLEQLREREQEHDRRPFAPLAQHHGAAHRDEHEDVDVERQRPRGVERPPDAVDAAADDRQPEGGDDGAVIEAGVLERHAGPASTPETTTNAAASRPTARARPAARAPATRACPSARRLPRSPTR